MSVATWGDSSATWGDTEVTWDGSSVEVPEVPVWTFPEGPRKRKKKKEERPRKQKVPLSFRNFDVDIATALLMVRYRRQ